jgi:hypothetical protein
MRKLSIILSFIISILIVTPIYSQVDLKMIMRNPTPSEIYEWQKDPTIIQIIVTNQSSNEYRNATFGFKITNENGTVIAESNPNSRTANRFTIATMPQITVLNGSQIIDVNSISYNSSLKSLLLSANSIPEGYYDICLSVYDQSGNNITNGEEYCTSFSVLVPEPPILLSPIEGEVLYSPFPNFLWTPVTSYNAARNQISYKLKICPVYKGQSARMAMDMNPVLLEKSNILSSSYMYLPSDMPFSYYRNVNQYVWMVQAFDMNGNPATSNQGKSELATFRIKAETESNISLSNVYPVNNDTIPWKIPHLATQFTPYSDDISSIEFTLRLKKDGEKTEYTNTRKITYNISSQAAQQLSSTEQASLLVASVGTNKSTPDWMQQLVPGVKYNWYVDATFTYNTGDPKTVSSQPSSFFIGFKNPTLSKPIKDTLIKINTKIPCIFSIPQPEKLNFTNVEVLSISAFHASKTKKTALNKFSIEIAKNSSFDTIIQTITKLIPENKSYLTGDACDDLFNKITIELDGIKDTASYYYRVKYLDNSDKEYFTSKSRSFKIVTDSIISCFEMKVQEPINNGTWTKSKKPKFSVSVSPKINKSAITGGHIKVWKKSTVTQSNVDAKQSKAVLDTTFKGNDDKKIFAFSTDMAGFTRYDLNFINGDSTSKTFTADTSSTYLWNFKLNYKKDSIRFDKKPCDCDSVLTDEGIFKVKPASELADSGFCPGECYADAPTKTTPGTQSLKKDTTITIGKFKLKLGTVSGSASGLSGDGSIDIPYLRGNILVEFNGLKINSDNIVYEGEAYGKIDETAPYSKPDANDFEGKALGYAQDKAKFKEIHEYSASSGKLVSALVGTAPVSLPLGFDRDYDGYKVVVGIVGMKFTPVRASLNTAMYIELPSLGPDVGLGFGAKDVCFHKDGLAGNGKKMIYLAQDFGYENDESWSFLFKAPTPSDSGTYAMWGCKGFYELVIDADVEFPRSWMKPVPDNDPTKLVKAHFKTRADKFGNGWEWLAIANLDDCELSGAEGYKLKVQEMVFDYSKARNPTGIVFPKNYTKDKDLHWQGFYIKTASIELPEKFKTFDEEHPIISVNNLLIDKIGFTASIQGVNLIQYPKGNFGEWGASIDTLKINLVSSSLESGRMNGRIKVSIFDTSLVYNGLLSNSSSDKKIKYLFTVNPKDSLDTELGKVKMYLYPTSKITLGDTTEGFFAAADLTGKFTIDGDMGGLKKLNFKGISFENLKLSTKSPYFDKGNIGFASPQHSMEGFPVTIDNFDIISASRGGGIGAALQFDLNVELQSGSDAISGTTKLSIWSTLVFGPNGQNFSFDGVELDSIGINADMGTVRIAGGLELYDSHSTFGNGFRGVVNATFVDQLSVEATAQFGNVNNYQYWYVDAKAIFPEAVPIAQGVGMYGFGGGAWYHMRKSGLTDLSDPANTSDNSTSPGGTNSGYSYVPDKNVDLGLKASLIIGTHPSEEAFNGDVGLEAQFIPEGGLGMVSLVGNGYMMCKITERNKAKVLADLDLEYNVSTNTFHGTFDVDINASPLDGGGRMVMHVDPNIWYLKIGEPSHPITLSLADWFEAQSYLMMGQNLPTPIVPSEILELFPGQIANRNPQIANGNGFAFGANASFDTGRKTYSIFYGEFSALAGFDMSMLNYTNGARCEGMDGSLGINGWYANGQIYSALSASIGLHVDLWFTEGNYEILSLNGGALLQGAGPNPTWLSGNVGGNYRILGGKVKGYCNFNFSMGEKCEMIQENPLSRIDLITDISPVGGSTDVEVMIEPQVASNFQLNESFDLQEMPDGGGAPSVRTFKVKLKDFELRKASNNNSISGIVNISPDKFSAYYSSHEMLAGNTNYNLEVSAYGEEYVNNVWNAAVKNDGSLVTQSESTSFKTGAAPDKIEKQHVAYSYPINNQGFFLQDECRSGKVQLKTGMSNLFAKGPMYDMELIARFVPSDESAQTIEVPFNYESGSKSIRFSIPTLQNETEYYIQFVKKQTLKETSDSKGAGDAKADNTNTSETTRSSERSAYDTESGKVIQSERKIMGKRVRVDDKILYAMHFTTSKYNSLQAKLNSFNYITTNSYSYANNVEEHRAAYEGDESFGYYDLHPLEWNKSGATIKFGPLLKVNGYDRSTAWHNQFVNPKVYNNINWMNSKGWWQSSMMTEFNHYQYSSNKELIEIKANGYYEPVTIPVAQLMPLTMSTNSYSAGSMGAASMGQTSTVGTTSLAQTTTFGVSSSSGVSAANAFGSSSSAGMFGTNSSSSTGIFGSTSGASFTPSSAAGANFSDLQNLEFATPNIIVTHNHGKVVPVDFDRLRNKAAYILSRWYIPKSNYESGRLNSIIHTDYVPMLRGNYPLKFYYNYRGCLGVDENNTIINKTFIY